MRQLSARILNGLKSDMTNMRCVQRKIDDDAISMRV